MDVLVADSDPLFGRNVKARLEKLGYAVTMVPDGNEAWRAWPNDKVAPSHIAEREGVAGQIRGQVVRRAVGVDEPLIKGALFTPGEGSHMADILKPGMRAVSIDVDPGRASRSGAYDHVSFREVVAASGYGGGRIHGADVDLEPAAAGERTSDVYSGCGGLRLLYAQHSGQEPCRQAPCGDHSGIPGRA